MRQDDVRDVRPRRADPAKRHPDRIGAAWRARVDQDDATRVSNHKTADLKADGIGPQHSRRNLHLGEHGLDARLFHSPGIPLGSPSSGDKVGVGSQRAPRSLDDEGSDHALGCVIIDRAPDDVMAGLQPVHGEDGGSPVQDIRTYGE